MKRFVKLFEEYTEADQKAQASETAHTWTDLRDAIQMKMPYLIITFNNADGYNKFISKHLDNKDYIKQSFFSVIDGQKKEFPSIFMIDSDQNAKNSVKNYYSDEYAVRHIIVNEMNSEYATMYFSDGSSSSAGNEIISANDPMEMKSDDNYKIASTYYKFTEAH